MIRKLIDISIICGVMFLMAWMFLHYFDVELDIRERQHKSNYMEGVIK